MPRQDPYVRARLLRPRGQPGDGDAAERGRFALRIHQAGYRSDAEIESELAFMEALRERGVPTTEVVPARGGKAFVVVQSPDVPEPRQCDLFEWIDGRLLRRVDDKPGLIHQ